MICEFCSLSQSQAHHAHYMMDKVALKSEINALKSQVFYLQEGTKKLVEIISRLTENKVED